MSAKFDQIIYETAVREGFSPTAAKFVVAQARFESADYSSNVFKNNLNTSGMKYVGQPLAERGTLAPANERSQSCRNQNVCRNSDYYAKFDSVADSAKDKIQRNFNLTLKGVRPEQLKNAKTPEEFATLLKQRGYYGDTVANYTRGLKAKLMRIQVVEFIDKNRNALIIGGILLLVGGLYLYKKK